MVKKTNAGRDTSFISSTPKIQINAKKRTWAETRLSAQPTPIPPSDNTAVPVMYFDDSRQASIAYNGT